jgi:hypothetical protein
VQRSESQLITNLSPAQSNSSDYLAEWTHLVSLLQTTHTPRFGANPLGSSDRANLKEGATAFFDRLTEMERLCAEHPLNRQDPDMRDRVAKEVEDLVTAGYRPFWNKGQGKGLEKCECTPALQRVVLLIVRAQICEGHLTTLQDEYTLHSDDASTPRH